MSAQSIPLNIKDELSGRNLVGRLSVIVERVPVDGALSAGTNNQDGTWSLKVSELADLRFAPSEDGDEVSNLTVRILRYDEDGFDYASTVALFDIHVGTPDGAPRVEGPTATEIKQDVEAQSAMVHWKAEVEQRLAQAEAAWKVELEERLAADKAAWEAELEERLAADKAAWEAEEMQRLADAQSTRKAQEQEHLAAAKAAWDYELKQTLTEAKAAWGADDEQCQKEAEAMWARDEERRLATAKQNWETETAQRLRDAEADWKADQEYRLTALRETWEAWEVELEERLAADKAAWEVELEERLAAAKAAWEVEETQRLADAQSAWKAQEQEHSETAWKVELEERLATAKAAWEAEETQRLADAQSAWKAQEQEHSEAAKAAWDYELKQTLTEATAAWQAVDERDQKEAETMWARDEESPPALAEPLEPDAPAEFHDSEPELYAEPDRKVLARHAIEEVKREAEQRKLELEERKRRGNDAALGFAEQRHRRTTRKARRKIGHVKPDIPWRKLALACSVIAGVFYLISSGGPNLTVLKNSLLSLRDRVAGQETQKLFFVRPARANVRAGASKASAVITQVVQATALLEIRRQGEWIEVILPGGTDKQGWVHSSLLTSEPAASPLQ